MNQIDTMKLAMKALEPFITPNWAGSGVDKANAAYTALRSALSEQSAQQQEPDMWRVRLPRWTAPGIWNPMPKTPNQQADLDDWKSQDGAVIEYAVVITDPLAPQPAQRTWVGLTDSEIEDCYQQGGIGRAAQILKEKNT